MELWVWQAAESSGSQDGPPDVQSAGEIPPPANESASKEKEAVEQPTSMVVEGETVKVANEPKAETETKEDPMAQIDALEKELAAKEAAKKKKK